MYGGPFDTGDPEDASDTIDSGPAMKYGGPVLIVAASADTITPPGG